MHNDYYQIDNAGRNLKYLLFLLCTFGLIMVYSSSYLYSKEIFGSSSHLFIKQLKFILMALTVSFIVSKTKYSFWIKYSLKLNLIVSFFLLLAFIPGIGNELKGASRWINVLGFGFQPGEVAKYTILLSAIYYFENFDFFTIKEKVVNFFYLTLPLVLILNQPDFGTFTISFLIIGFVGFISNFPRKLFYSTFFSGIILGGVLLISQPYRVQRLLTFLDPWQNPRGSGFQIIQSYIAFANGSLFGAGLGNSTEKLFYLPEAHNDFIFSVIGEELGFLGVFCLVSLYLVFLFFLYKAAINIKDRVGSMVISTVMFTISIQAVFNMGVTLGLLPTKGLNLPFVSSGGSSLIANFFGIGLIFAVLNSYKKRYESNQHLNHSQY